MEAGFEEGTPEELARSMEHEIEGLLELDDFDLPGAPASSPPEDQGSAGAAANRRDRARPSHGRTSV